MTLARYQFLPWARQGLATALTTPDAAGAPSVASVRAGVVLADAAGESSAVVSVRLHGPGDVRSIDPREIIRLEPPAGATDFEPNYFPLVEFDHPDFPWLFSPAAPTADGRLRPWICLVVVPRAPGISVGVAPGSAVATLAFQSPADPAAELPDLSESWAWAHAQVATDPDGGSLAAQLARNDARTLSRLLCARRLAPNTTYDACIVPTFAVGRDAGLGAPITATDLRPAWDASTRAPFALPVYAHWTFTTSAQGDFESLARRLMANPLPDGVGRRALTVTVARPAEPPVTAQLRLEGALRVPGNPPGAWPPAHRERFQRLMRELAASMTVDGTPVLGPPAYGSLATGGAGIPADGASPAWLRELNLDPRWRVAAGLGVRVVQVEQESLMAAAWEQMGEIRRVNRALREAQLARSVGQALREKHLVPVSPGALLQVTHAAHRHLRFDSGAAQRTLERRIHESAVPDAAASPAFRRAARPQGRIGRRLGTVAPGRILEELNAGEIAVAPPRRAPRGTVTVDAVTDASGSAYAEARFDRATSRKVADAVGFADVPAPQPLAPATSSSAAAGVVQPLAMMRRPWENGGGGGPPTLDEDRLTRATVIAAFKRAAKGHQHYVEKVIALSSAPAPAPPLALPDVRTEVLERLDPAVTVRDRVRARVVAPELPGGAGDPLETLRVSLTIPQPMVQPLRELSQDFVLPGAEHVPQDTVALLETNPAFVEAYLVGLNHEMSRELLWRGFPADLRGTFFRRFWGLGDADEIPPLHLWDGSRSLGANYAVDPLAQVVLLVRGELLRRYPRATIYAVPARWEDGRRVLGEGERYPLMRVSLLPDAALLVFDVAVAVARGDADPARESPGWFVVLQEQPTEPRFGLDETPDVATPTSWAQLAWAHVRTGAGGHLRIAESASGLGAAPAVPTWNAHAAHMAAITLQRPARIAIHAGALLAPSGA